MLNEPFILSSRIDWSILIERHICFLCTPVWAILLYQGSSARRVWRYQRGNQNPYIEEEHTTQWPKEKVQKDKQRFKKNIHIELKIK
jgi:hypothetical protein